MQSQSLAFGFAALLACGGAPMDTPSTSAELRLLQNREVGYSLSYPSGWLLRGQVLATSFAREARCESVEIVDAAPPPDSGAAFMRHAFVQVCWRQRTDTASLDDYVRGVYGPLLDRLEKTTLGGVPAWRVRQDNGQHSVLQTPAHRLEKSAGWHLREQLGEANLFAVFPHSCVMANMGGVNGRLALGLFETAFSAVNNKPMAFPLDHGPFGEQLFDASLDELTTDPYRKAFDAYLYLGPLEDEVFSPLIPGFYTDEFMQELERRSRVMSGKGLVAAYGLKSADAQDFVNWMSQDWGQPRREWSARSLGPLNAWQLGSDWEKNSTVSKLANLINETNAVRQAAMRLFDAIRKANYERPGDWRKFPAPDIEYQVYPAYPAWMKWI